MEVSAVGRRGGGKKVAKPAGRRPAAGKQPSITDMFSRG